MAAKTARGQLAQLRDRAIALENREVKELLRLGHEEVRLALSRCAVRDQAAFQQEQVAAARRRTEERAAAYALAFGSKSLFSESVQPAFAQEIGKPVPPSTIAIPALDALRPTAWTDLSSLRPVGFLREGNTCYVNSVAHVLLRVPAMSAWFEKHKELCTLGETCLLCVLAATRKQLQFPRPRGQLPQLALSRGLVGAGFASDRQQDANEFMIFLLEKLRSDELQARRMGVWGNLRIDVPVATHVERLFAFVRETRRRCQICSMDRVWYESANTWLVKVSTLRGSVQTLSQAYIQSCQPLEETVICPKLSLIHI